MKNVAIKAGNKKPFDWIKWLIVIYTVVAGVMMAAAPFNILAILAFYIGMVAMHAHYKADRWLNKKIQFWGMLLFALAPAIGVTATLWLMVAAAHIFKII